MTVVLVSMFTGAFVSIAKVLRSELGFVILLVGEKYQVTLVHCGSKSFIIVTRSLMASEFLPLILRFYFSYITSHIFEQILRLQVQIEAYVYGKTVFDVYPMIEKDENKPLDR